MDDQRALNARWKYSSIWIFLIFVAIPPPLKYRILTIVDVSIQYATFSSSFRFPIRNEWMNRENHREKYEWIKKDSIGFECRFATLYFA